MASLKEQRVALIDSAEAIFDSAKAANRPLNDSENRRVKALLDEVDQVDANLAKADDAKSLLKRLGGLDPEQETPDGSFGRRYIDTGVKARETLAATIVGKIPGGAKALVGGSTVTTVIPFTPVNPIQAQKVPTSILSILPVTGHAGPQYQYLRQSTRTNNAAIVAAGGTKPTSIYTLTAVPGSLQVFAHLSEPLDKYLLQDATALVQFVGDELVYGLYGAIENEVLNGAGTTGHLTGILNTSGVQTVSQAASSDSPIDAIRRGIGALETAGYSADVIVLNPVDWQAIELTRTTTGEFVIETGPIDRAKKQLFGVQVVTSTRITAKTAAVWDQTAIGLDTDNYGIETRWTDAGALFSTNQLQARSEGRFGVSVYKPTGVVKVTLQ